MWILLISPWESLLHEWEAKVFRSEEEVEEYIRSHDLTKEHYYLPIKEMVKILAEKFDALEIEEEKKEMEVWQDAVGWWFLDDQGKQDGPYISREAAEGAWKDEREHHQEWRDEGGEG